MKKNVYCISDIHNDLDSFQKMLELIEFSKYDEMYILGDIFGRGPDPFGVYKEVLKHENMIPLMGNHEFYLAKSILDGSKETRSHSRLAEVLTEIDLIELKDWISKMPLQKSVVVNGKTYLMAHAETAENPGTKDPFFFLMGIDSNVRFLREEVDSHFLKHGIEGCVSVIGHYPTNVIRHGMKEKSVYPNSIWSNEKGNVFAIDCGNGYRSEQLTYVRLGCLRLNDYECFYV